MNGHAIELLPGNRVVIAASHVANGPGDRLSVYDRTSHRFTKHPRLDDVEKVKSVHIDPATKKLLWIQSDGPTWWSDALHLWEPETSIPLPGEKIYKARWMPVRR